MTETGAAACIMAHREPRHAGTNCFGRAEAFVETRVVARRATSRAIDAPGELLVRAARRDPRKDFFLDYLKDEAATEEAWPTAGSTPATSSGAAPQATSTSSTGGRT
jgi:hypothetical protein